MPLTTDPVYPIPTFTVEAWPDPVIDELGHDPRSAYVERFWLPVLGPSTVWFLRRLADHLDREPDGFNLDLVDTARSLGVGMRGGRNSPMLKTIERSCRFGAARMHGTTSLAVRRRLAPLTRAQVERLPEPLQREHTVWLTRPRYLTDGRADEGTGPVARARPCSSSARTPTPSSASSTTGASTRPWPTRPCAGPSTPVAGPTSYRWPVGRAARWPWSAPLGHRCPGRARPSRSAPLLRPRRQLPRRRRRSSTRPADGGG